MICPGITVHCPGCSGRQSAALLGAVVAGLLVLDQAVPWVAARVWWIGGTVAVAFAVATAAAMWLERWTGRRATAWGAAHGIVSRADVTLPPGIRSSAADLAAGICRPQTDLAREIGMPVPDSGAVSRTGVRDSAHLEITGGTHLWILGQPDAEQAEIIRRALPSGTRNGYRH